MSQFRIEDLGMLPMHLMVMVLEADQDEAFFKYLLSGLTLLNKLYFISDRHPTLKQVSASCIWKSLRKFNCKGAALYLHLHFVFAADVAWWCMCVKTVSWSDLLHTYSTQQINRGFLHVDCLKSLCQISNVTLYIIDWYGQVMFCG